MPRPVWCGRDQSGRRPTSARPFGGTTSRTFARITKRRDTAGSATVVSFCTTAATTSTAGRWSRRRQGRVEPTPGTIRTGTTPSTRFTRMTRSCRSSVTSAGRASWIRL
uniref:(northern house mosquito) hypothetical protein n=1 Tax=Culex pipiens TaxID=7175 RepID=A0A8D8NSA4_CULPI